MPRSLAFIAYSFLIIALMTTVGCTPRQEGATPSGLYAAGRANFNISVTSAMTLASTASLSAQIPSDVTVSPRGTMRYALFAEGESGPVTRHAHILFSELPRPEWQWEIETWAQPGSLSYEKQRTAGKYWTSQILPVFSGQDWFSEIWRGKGRDIPEFWLAKRWSSTPERHIRIVAEYREPAPVCMNDKLTANAANKNHAPLRGQELWRNCDDAIREFSARADQAFVFERATNLPAEKTVTPGPLPSSPPDMAKLAGKAEHIVTYNTGGN